MPTKTKQWVFDFHNNCHIWSAGHILEQIFNKLDDNDEICNWIKHKNMDSFSLYKNLCRLEKLCSWREDPTVLYILWKRIQISLKYQIYYMQATRVRSYCITKQCETKLVYNIVDCKACEKGNIFDGLCSWRNYSGL